MPLPSFWPEKATEWIALIGGALGGLLGTLAFVLSVLNYRRDRAKLAFAAEQLEPEPILPPDFDTTQGYDKIVFPDNVIFKLRVTNLGRRPIRIEEAWAILSGPRPAMFLKVQRGEKEDGPTGVVLTESDRSVICVTTGYIKGFSLKDIIRFEVYDSGFRQHRYYHRGYLRTHISEIPNWVRLYLWNWQRRRQIRKTIRRVKSEFAGPLDSPPSRAYLERMPAQAPPTLKSRFEAFCRQFPGAEVIDDILTPEQKLQIKGGMHVADYFFENRTIIVEQKSLEKETAAKLEAFMKQSGITTIPPGEPTVESLFLALPNGENLYRKAIDLVTTPIADGLDDAQKQIRDTKSLFGIPSADGLLIILNEIVTVAGPPIIKQRLEIRLAKATDDGSPYHKDINRFLHIGESWVPQGLPDDTTFNVTLPNPTVQETHGVEAFVFKLAEAWAKFNGHTFSVVGNEMQAVLDKSKITVRME
jgi:hypothetical protein